MCIRDSDQPDRHLAGVIHEQFSGYAIDVGGHQPDRPGTLLPYPNRAMNKLFKKLKNCHFVEGFPQSPTNPKQ